MEQLDTVSSPPKRTPYQMRRLLASENVVLRLYRGTLSMRDKLSRCLDVYKLSWSLILPGVGLFILSFYLLSLYSSASSYNHYSGAATSHGTLLQGSQSCQRACCSAKPMKLGNFEKMTSSWWSNSFSNGSQVHLSSAHGTWWGPANEANDWSIVGCQHGEIPDISSALTVIREGESSVRFVTPRGKFLVARSADRLGGDEALPGESTLFSVVPVEGSPDLLLIRVPDGKSLRCTREGELLQDVESASDSEQFRVLEVASVARWRGVNLGSWLVLEDWMVPEVVAPASGARHSQEDAAQLFPESMRDEWKLAKKLGPSAARARLERHYRSFVTATDMRFLAQQGINAVRVPVGWWLARGGSTLSEWEFLQGQVAHLDRAFTMAQRHNLGVLLSLHASPSAERSAALDGEVDWGVFPELVQLMLEAVDWLALRYSERPNYLGISLLSENIVSGVPLDMLKKFYLGGYEAVRRHSPCAFVGIAVRHKGQLEELRGFMAEAHFTNVVLDVTMYASLTAELAGKPLQDAVRMVERHMQTEIEGLQRGGRLVLVGEWSLAHSGPGGESDGEMREFADALLAALGSARAGWFFWTLKMGRQGWPHWSFYDSIARGWLRRTKDGAWH